MRTRTTHAKRLLSHTVANAFGEIYWKIVPNFPSKRDLPSNTFTKSPHLLNSDNKWLIDCNFSVQLYSLQLHKITYLLFYIYFILLIIEADPIFFLRNFTRTEINNKKVYLAAPKTLTFFTDPSYCTSYSRTIYNNNTNVASHTTTPRIWWFQRIIKAYATSTLISVGFYCYYIVEVFVPETTYLSVGEQWEILTLCHHATHRPLRDTI